MRGGQWQQPELGLPPAPLVAAIERHMHRYRADRAGMAEWLHTTPRTLLAFGVGTFIPRGNRSLAPPEWKPAKCERAFIFWVTADAWITYLGLNWFDVYDEESVGEYEAQRAAVLLGGEAVAV